MESNEMTYFILTKKGNLSCLFKFIWL